MAANTILRKTFSARTDGDGIVVRSRTHLRMDCYRRARLAMDYSWRARLD
jgi:hypothetical protein